MRRNINWPERDVERIAEMRDAGQTWDEIAAVFRVRRETIRKVAIQHGIPGAFRWTRDAINRMMRDYATTNDAVLAKDLCCSVIELQAQAGIYGLRKRGKEILRSDFGEAPLPPMHSWTWGVIDPPCAFPMELGE